MKFLSTHERNVTGTGNGATLQAELWEAVGDTKIKNLGAPISSVEGQPFSIPVNTDPQGGVNSIPVGTDHVIKINDGVFPEVSNLDGPFEIVDANITDYPTIPWFNAGVVVHMGNLAYNDVAKTTVAELYETDAVLGRVGNVDTLDLSAAPSNPTQFNVTQSNTSNKPRLAIDAEGYVYTTNEFGGVSSCFILNNTGTPVTITNDSVVETTTTCVVGNGVSIQSSNSTIGFNLQVRTDGASLPLGLAFVFYGQTFVLPASAGEKIVVREVISSGPGFGESKVFVNDVEILSVPQYVPNLVLDNTTIWRRFNSPSAPGIRVYGATLFREGVLTPTQQAAVYQWHKDIAGIV